MRDIEKMRSEGEAVAERFSRYDLHISEIGQLYDEFLDNPDKSNALFDVITKAYFFGMSAGMRYEKNKRTRLAANSKKGVSA